MVILKLIDFQQQQLKNLMKQLKNLRRSKLKI